MNPARPNRAMEHYDLHLLRGRRPTFEAVPAAACRRVFGVDYVAVRGLKGGDMYFTREGWALAASLLPPQWYDGQRFRQIGQALTAGTGAVYRVPVPHPLRGTLGIVVKFCRFGQDVGLTRPQADCHFPWPDSMLPGAEFLGPFAEFGRVAELRRTLAQQDRLPFHTKRPLAIYCPPARYPRWQLGRDPARDWLHDRSLAADQAQAGDRAVRHDWERLYILLYQWIDGLDAQDAHTSGLFNEAAMVGLTQQAARDLAGLGFAILDHKPRHVIVRPNRHGLLRRGGRLAYALIDYELLIHFRPPAASALPDAAIGATRAYSPSPTK